MKKIIAFVLAALMALFCLSACGQSHNADTVMTVNGSEVSWDEYMYWMAYSVDQIEQKYSYAGAAVDYTNDEDIALIMKGAKQAVLEQHVILAKAAELGISVDEEKVDEVITNYISYYCGEDATEEDFETLLADSYSTMDTFKTMIRSNFLYTDIINNMYGEGGADISDEDIQSYAQQNEYVTATHILLLTTDEDGEELSSSQKAKLERQAKGFVSELQAIDDNEKRLERFNELKAEYCEDTGKEAYPDGYCFTTGTMVSEFDTAARELGEYEVSDVIETDYGYHVIMRLPLTGDDLCSGSDGYPVPLRTLVAENLFTVEFEKWIKEAQVEFVGKYKNYQFEGLFDENGFNYISYKDSLTEG